MPSQDAEVLRDVARALREMVDVARRDKREDSTEFREAALYALDTAATHLELLRRCADRYGALPATAERLSGLQRWLAIPEEERRQAIHTSSNDNCIGYFACGFTGWVFRDDYQFAKGTPFIQELERWAYKAKREVAKARRDMNPACRPLDVIAEALKSHVQPDPDPRMEGGPDSSLKQLGGIGVLILFPQRECAAWARLLRTCGLGEHAAAIESDYRAFTEKAGLFDKALCIHAQACDASRAGRQNDSITSGMMELNTAEVRLRRAVVELAHTLQSTAEAERKKPKTPAARTSELEAEKGSGKKRIWDQDYCPVCAKPGLEWVSHAKFERRTRKDGNAVKRETASARIKDGKYLASFINELPWCPLCKGRTPEGTGEREPEVDEQQSASNDQARTYGEQCAICAAKALNLSKPPSLEVPVDGKDGKWTAAARDAAHNALVIVLLEHRARGQELTRDEVEAIAEPAIKSFVRKQRDIEASAVGDANDIDNAIAASKNPRPQAQRKAPHKGEGSDSYSDD